MNTRISWIASAFIEKAKQLKENATEVPEVPFRLTELHHVVFRSQTCLSSCDPLRFFSTTSQSCDVCLLPLSGGNCNDLFHLNWVWSSAAVIIIFFFLDFNRWTQNCLWDKGELHQSRLYSRFSAEWDERQSPPLVLHLIFNGAGRTTCSQVTAPPVPCVSSDYPSAAAVSCQWNGMPDSPWFFGSNTEKKEIAGSAPPTIITKGVKQSFAIKLKEKKKTVPIFSYGLHLSLRLVSHLFPVSFSFSPVKPPAFPLLPHLNR